VLTQTNEIAEVELSKFEKLNIVDTAVNVPRDITKTHVIWGMY
jgi:hypothetical protein